MKTNAMLLPPAFARHWATELGCKESSLERLQGGINNRVYRCGKAGQHKWVIKGYVPLDPGDRDRMQAEIDFLRYAGEVAPGYAPQLVKVDEYRRCIIMEHLDGEAFPEGVAPPMYAVSYAMEFLRLLNTDHSIGYEFIRQDAADGFLKLTEHLLNIEYRLKGMHYDHLPEEVKPEANHLLTSMQSLYKEIYTKTNDDLWSGKFNDSIHPKERVISPSDFGFHNARWTKKGKVMFLDFEYSGWDDPAKTIIDFLLQPRISVNQSLRTIINKFPSHSKEILINRVQALTPILGLKWLCIILAVLNSDRLSSIIDVTNEDNTRQFVQDRFRLARVYLQRLESNLPILPSGC